MRIRLRPAASSQSITEGVIWKQLLIFFFPILLGTFFQQMYNTADAIIVGNVLSKQALAAVGGSTGTLINLIVGFFMGLSSGATVIISQYFGARNDKDVSRTVQTAMAIAVLFGLIITLMGEILSPVLLKWMDTQPDVMPDALSYIRVCFLGMIPSLIYNIGSGILRAVGDSKRPLYFLIAACFTNIFLDILLMKWLGMGVAGAALATVISQVLCAVLVLLVLIRSPQCYQYHPRQTRIHGDLMGKIIRIGLPAGLQSVMYSISNVLIQRTINGFESTDIVAAWTAWGKLDGLQWMVLNAFSISVTTFVGQNFGARQYARVKKSTGVGLAMAAASTLMISALFLTIGEFALGLFTPDQAVIDQGVIILKILAPSYILYIFVEIYAGSLRGCGDSLIPTLLTLFGICALRLVWLLYFIPQPRFHTLENTVLSYPITWAITSILFIIYYFFGGWMKRCKKKAGFPLTEN